MPITVELRTEDGARLGPFPDDLYLESSDLPEYDDARYPYLRLVDPYGNTVLSRYQMAAALPEIERLAEQGTSSRIDELLKLARRCASEVHTYLWFIGD